VLQLHLFGPPEITAAGGSVRAVLAQPKRFALLVYLALAEPRGAHRRDALVALFWPDRPEDAARAALSRATHFLRQSLGAELLIGRTVEELTVDHALLRSDVAEFERLRTAGDFAAAMALYRGDLLPGFHADEAPEFMRWLDDMRSRLRGDAATCARQLAQRSATDGATADAVTWAERALQLAPYDERAMHLLLEALVTAGNRTGALRSYDAFAHRIAADLEAEPSTALRALVDRIRTGETSGAPAESLLEATPSVSHTLTSSTVRTERTSAVTSTPSTPHQVRDLRPTDLARSVAAPEIARTTPATAPGVAAAAPPRRAARSRWPLVALTALLVLSAGALALRPRTRLDSRAMLGDKVQLTRSNRVTLPTISPDGKQLAYMEERCDDAACGQALVVQDVGGLGTRVLLDSIAAPREIKWSPDRRTLYFYGRHGTQTGAWLQDLIGGAPRRIGNGPTDFFADGDSVLAGPTFHADSVYTLRVASRAGVVHDSIVLRVPGGGISSLSAIPGTPYFVALVNRPPHGWWQVFDRTGRLVDHVENACVCGGTASNDALWLSRSAGLDGEAAVRLALDRQSGRINPRQDTILKGVFSSFSTTADGSRFVADIGKTETSVWLPSVQELRAGILPAGRRVEQSSQPSQWLMSPDGTRILIRRTAAVGARTGSVASIRSVADGAERSLAFPGDLRAAVWADSVTIAFRVRGAGDSLVFGLLDLRDGSVRERFVPGEAGVRASARIADGWAWIPVDGHSVRVMQHGVKHDWAAPRWYNELFAVVGGTDVRSPIVLGVDRATGDSADVSALDVRTGRFETWIRRTSEGLAAIVMQGDGRVVLKTSRMAPFAEYTLLTGPAQATPIVSLRQPHVRVSFSRDLSRVVTEQDRYNADAWMFQVLRR
jgi:DNA-binding SARP family transcriptional activator